MPSGSIRLNVTGIDTATVTSKHKTACAYFSDKNVFDQTITKERIGMKCVTEALKLLTNPKSTFISY